MPFETNEVVIELDETGYGERDLPPGQYSQPSVVDDENAVAEVRVGIAPDGTTDFSRATLVVNGSTPLGAVTVEYRVKSTAKPRKSTAKKTTKRSTKKSTAKKATTTKKAPAKRSTAKKTAAKKTTARKRPSVKKSAQAARNAVRKTAKRATKKSKPSGGRW